MNVYIYICGRELWGLFGRVGYGMGWCLHLHLDWIGLFFVDLHRYIYIYTCVCVVRVCVRFVSLRQ